MKSFFKDFKAFLMRGNVVDMAVGVVIGAAFGNIITSLVDNIIMPAISLITGAINLADLAVTVTSPLTGEVISLQYGLFIQACVNFFIIALAIFFCIWGFGKIRRKKAEAEEEAAAEPTQEEVLLTEIRDILKVQNGVEETEAKALEEAKQELSEK